MTKTMTPSRRLILVLLVLALTALACGLPVIGIPEATPPSEPAPPAEATVEAEPQAEDAPIDIEAPLPGDSFLVTGDALADLYDRVVRGVVSVRILSATGGGQGTGFIVDDQGHIITNYHVIEGATDIEIGFWNGFKAHGEIIGTDLDSDLAVLRVEAPAEQLYPLPLGDSDQIRVGEVAVAIGNPFGLGSTMTVGIVSAKGRVLSSLNVSEEGQAFSAGDLIQTDAAINPGNSGGPLLNLNGEVIGVNRAIRTDNFNDTGSPVSSGIGFAISVNIVKRVLPSLIENGEVAYPLLGISSLPELTIFDQEELNLPQSTGALVISLTPDGPAEEAGLLIGDLITHIDGREVLVFGDLLSYLFTQKSPGDSVVLTVLRGGEALDFTVVLGSR